MKFTLLTAAIVFFLVTENISAQFLVVDSEGKELNISVIDGIDAETLAYSHDGQEKNISLDEISAIRTEKPQKFEFPVEAVLLELCDGSKILAEKFSSDGKKLAFMRIGGETAEISIDLVNSARFALDNVEEIDRPNAQWTKLVQGKKPNGDRLIVKTYDYFDGLIEAIEGDSVKFNLEGEQLPVKISKIAGLIYHRSGDSPRQAPAVCVLKEISGSKLNLAKISLTDGNLVWETAAGMKGQTPLGQLFELDFSSKNFVSLLDLEPIAYERAPVASWMQEGAMNAHVLDMLDKFSRPRIEKDIPEDEFESQISENPAANRVRPGTKAGPVQKDIPQIRGLVLDGKRYACGISLPAKSAITYNLDQPYLLFRGIAGIDDRLRPNGRIKLRIYGDERQLFETEIYGDAASKPFEVEIEGVRNLKIVAEFIDGFASGAQLNLVDLKLARP